MAQTKHPVIFGLICSLLGTAQVSAQEIDSTEIPLKITQELRPIEVRFLRVESKSPFSKTDISKESIEQQNLGQDLPVLLQMTPSAVSSSDAGAGVGYTNLRIRGTDGTRINVTLNGIPVNDAESQGTFFVNLPDLASSTNSIQLQRGVGSSTNGSGSFGATMSISNMEQMEKAGASINMSAGSFNTQKYTLKAGTGLLNNGWQFDVRLSKITSEGYIQRSASDLKSLQVIGSWQIRPQTRFRFQILNGQEKTGQAWNGVAQDSLQTNRRYNELGRKTNGSFYDNQTDNYGQTYYQAFLDHTFNKYWTGQVGLFLTRGKGYYEEYKSGESFGSYGLNDFITPSGDTFSSTDMIRQLWLDNYFYGGIYGIQYQKNKWLVNIGGAVSQYSGLHYGIIKWADYGIPDNYSWYRNDAMKNDFNQFVKMQYKANQKLTLYGDAQVRIVSYFMNGFRKNPALRPAVTYTFFNPKAGFNYMLQDAYQHKSRIYASLAMAQKEPNRNDFEASPNQLPQPEKLLNLEAGYEIERKNWSATANVYWMNYKDQLVLNGQVNDVGAYTRVNVDKSYRLGLEMIAQAKVFSWFHISGNISFSDNKIKNFTEYIDDYDNGTQIAIGHKNADIAFSPNVIAALDLGFKPFHNKMISCFKNMEFHLLSKHVGKQYLDNTSDERRSIASYTLFDFRLNYSWHFKNDNEVNLILGIYNLLNTRYENNGYNFNYIYGGQLSVNNYYYPQAGTNFLVGVGMKLF